MDDPVKTADYKENEKSEKHVEPDMYLPQEMIVDEEQRKGSVHDNNEGEEDSYIQIVNELATMDDDPSLPSFTLRAVVVGTVSP